MGFDFHRPSLPRAAFKRCDADLILEAICNVVNHLDRNLEAPGTIWPGQPRRPTPSPSPSNFLRRVRGWIVANFVRSTTRSKALDELYQITKRNLPRAPDCVIWKIFEIFDLVAVVERPLVHSPRGAPPELVLHAEATRHRREVRNLTNSYVT